jgi:hypothetical protein
MPSCVLQGLHARCVSCLNLCAKPSGTCLRRRASTPGSGDLACQTVTSAMRASFTAPPGVAGGAPRRASRAPISAFTISAKAAVLLRRAVCSHEGFRGVMLCLAPDARQAPWCRSACTNWLELRQHALERYRMWRVACSFFVSATWRDRVSMRVGSDLGALHAAFACNAPSAGRFLAPSADRRSLFATRR